MRTGRRAAGGATGPIRFALALLLLLFAITLHFGMSRQWPGFDFYQFWAVGQAVQESDVGNVYDAKEGERISRRAFERSQSGAASGRQRQAGRMRASLEVFSTPFLYGAFGLASTGDYEADYTRYQVLSIAAAALSVVALCRVLGYGWASALLLTAVLMLVFDPFFSDLKMGNVNRLQLGGLAAFLCLQARTPRGPRDLLGGFLLGLVLAFKPNFALVPVLLCLSWLIDRRHRTLVLQCAGMAGGAAAAVAFSSLRFGSFACWLHWREALVSLAGGEIRERFLALPKPNLSVSQAIFEATGYEVSLALTVVLLAATFVALAIGRSGGPASAAVGRNLERDVLVTGLACAIALLAAPLAWVHYFVLVVPLVVFLLRPAGRGDGLSPAMRWLPRGLAALAIAMFAPSRLVEVLGLSDPDQILRLGRGLFGGATLVLFLVALWALAQQGSARGAGELPA